MKQNHGKRQYDCVIGYSGGKDSTALLNLIYNEYNLTPLAITVDMGFMSDIAKQNIKDTLEKINVDHIFISEANNTFTKLYYWHFINHFSFDKCLTKDICDYCSDLLHSIIVKEAMNRNIRIILLGYSPDQIARYFYEMPRDEMVNEWKPDLIFNDSFTDNDRRWYIDSKNISINNLPRVLLPYHVLDYQEDKIIELVESKNLIKKGNADPLKTNCYVVSAALFYDINRYGGIPYIFQFAELVRQDPSIRKKWLRTLKRISPLILNAKFNENGVKEFFEKINVSKESLLETIQKQIEQDPNKDQILRNLNLIKSLIKKHIRKRI